MKTVKCAALTFTLLTTLFAGAVVQGAQQGEPTVYIIKKGDTLWGLSNRFMKDPYYWPNLWARNPENIVNPHFIFPGQKLRVYSDRIEVEPVKKSETSPVATPAEPSSVTGEVKEQLDVPVPERHFTVNGGEGFIAGSSFKPSGYIIAGQHNRQIYAEDDLVYTDIGRNFGGKVGDRYTVFKNYGPVSHPLTNQILGYRVAALGTLQLTEIENRSSKALITSSFMEIEPGSSLAPYRNMRKEVTLRAADLDLNGYIVETRTGNKAIAAGDVAYIDLGENQGVKVGNMLYVVRKAETEIKFYSGVDYDLPVDVLGALVVVETAENTSTALVVKSIDTIYTGDRLEMKKGH
ncbi:MAG TPA: LysM domain-containing protein [Geobacteraceae bacterium]|nr:LysM domain-containing protein [Geobacteraceae bacterium]